MRINQFQIEILKTFTAKHFGSEAVLYLFGSRTDDSKKGGDIDLYIETNLNDGIFLQKIKFLADIKNKLGEQKIDVVVNNGTYPLHIYEIAKEEGVRL